MRKTNIRPKKGGKKKEKCKTQERQNIHKKKRNSSKKEESPREARYRQKKRNSKKHASPREGKYRQKKRNSINRRVSSPAISNSTNPFIVAMYAYAGRRGLAPSEKSCLIPKGRSDTSVEVWLSGIQFLPIRTLIKKIDTRPLVVVTKTNQKFFK